MPNEYFEKLENQILKYKTAHLIDCNHDELQKIFGLLQRRDLEAIVKKYALDIFSLLFVVKEMNQKEVKESLQADETDMELILESSEVLVAFRCRALARNDDYNTNLEQITNSQLLLSVHNRNQLSGGPANTNNLLANSINHHGQDPMQAANRDETQLKPSTYKYNLNQPLLQQVQMQNQ